MRPRSFDRGNGRLAFQNRRRSARFNEAAIFRSRKRGVLRVPSRFDSGAGFNEAAIFRSRKHHVLPTVEQTSDAYHASMRPRSFDRGN